MRPAAGSLALALLGASAPAAAQEPRATAPDWAFGAPGGEVVLAAAGVASLTAFFLPQRNTGWAPYSSRAHDPTVSLISDFTGALGGSLLVSTQAYGFEGAYLGQGGVPRPFERALRTSLIDLEAVTLSTGMATAIKRITGRCRPRAFLDGRCGELDTDFDAFPSGHTTPVAALAGVHLSLALRTPGDAALRYGAFGVAEGATLVTMALRVAAGAHSWEDVGAGWVLGHVTGVVLGFAHPMIELTEPEAPASPPPAPAMLSWSGRF